MHHRYAFDDYAGDRNYILAIVGHRDRIPHADRAAGLGARGAAVGRHIYKSGVSLCRDFGTGGGDHQPILGHRDGVPIIRAYNSGKSIRR